jgi:hypothetical protein
VSCDEERGDSQQDACGDADPSEGAHQGAFIELGTGELGTRFSARRIAHDAIGPDVAGARGAGREGDEALSVKDMLRAVSFKRDLHHARAWRVRDGLRAQEARVFLQFSHRRRAPRVAVRVYGRI